MQNFNFNVSIRKITNGFTVSYYSDDDPLGAFDTDYQEVYAETLEDAIALVTTAIRNNI